LDFARTSIVSLRAVKEERNTHATGLSSLLRDLILLCFLACAFLLHLANAAMLPQLGEMPSKDSPKAAAPFMSACIVVTQPVISLTAAWIGKRAATKGRKPLLLLGVGVLPLRGLLYTLTHAAGLLIAVQTLDGVASAIFSVVSILGIKDRTRGTGRFNMAAGALATMVGIGAEASTTIGGTLIQRLGYRASFPGLSGSLHSLLPCSGSPCLKPFPTMAETHGVRLESNTKPKKSFLPNEGDLRRAEPPPEPTRTGEGGRWSRPHLPILFWLSLSGSASC
jgi:hypothetical protein